MSSKGAKLNTQEDPYLSDLPSIEGEVCAVMAEMEALRALFLAGHPKTNGNILHFLRARKLAEEALKLRSADETFDDRLTTFCLSYLLGRKLRVPKRSTATRLVRQSFEQITIGWMRWIATKDASSVMLAIEALYTRDQGQSDNTVDHLVLQYWASALEALVAGEKDRARASFEQATDVACQFGLALNPPISWVYATSFWTNVYEQPKGPRRDVAATH
jgi:hypothetical protein